MLDDLFIVRFARMTKVDLDLLKAAAYSGEYVEIRKIIIQNDLLSNCGSCFYTDKLAYDILCKARRLNLI